MRFADVICGGRCQNAGHGFDAQLLGELGESDLDEETRDFADKLSIGTLDKVDEIDSTIRTRAEHWRIERMAIVDRNVLRMAVYEFLFSDTPHTVVINEALEIARRFSHL
jgi:N utilization substance protein B